MNNYENKNNKYLRMKKSSQTNDDDDNFEKQQDLRDVCDKGRPSAVVL